MLVAEQLLLDGEGVSIQVLGFVILALLHQHQRQVVQALCDGFMLVAEQLLLDGEGVSVQVLGFVISSLFFQHPGESVLAVCYIKMDLAKQAAPQIQGLYQQRVCLFVFTQLPIHHP